MNGCECGVRCRLRAQKYNSWADGEERGVMCILMVGILD